MEYLLKLLKLFMKPVKQPEVILTTSITPRKLAEDIVRREGGYVNDPSDPGGATKWGVTIGTMKALGIDLDKNGVVNIADVKLLTEKEAVDIYLKHYFDKPRINELPGVLHATVFDMYVNSGNNAVKILQKLLGMTSDGSIGPATIKAAKDFYARSPDYLESAYGIARRNYYYSLADVRPASRKYAKRKDGGKGGWITRAEEFMLPKYRLTEDQHKARVKDWK